LNVKKLNENDKKLAGQTKQAQRHPDELATRGPSTEEKGAPY